MGRVLINRHGLVDPTDVRLASNNGRKADIDLGPFRAKNGSRPSLDNKVCAFKHRLAGIDCGLFCSF
jgi:hypothetical protein